jgi:hypothetical protein
MNSLLSIISSILIFFITALEVPYNSIQKAMTANDSKAIVQLGKDKVLLNILGKEGAYNHAQAEMVLNEFFTKKPKGAFAFVFKGKESSDGVFAIGKYTYGKESYRTTFHFRAEKSEAKLESLTIEKE